MTVVDASVVYALLRDPRGRHAQATLGAGDLAAPALLDLEVTQKLRWDVLNGRFDEAAGVRGVERLRVLPIQRHDHTEHLARIWDLRENLAAYDAAYVALAEHLSATLLTADQRLARSSAVRCRVEVIG